MRRLLTCLPIEYLHGLGEVVLIDAAALRQANRWHNHRAVYYPGTRDWSAFIEVVVDRVLQGSPDLFQWAVGLVAGQTVWFAQVLYHEIGHHIDHLSGSALSGNHAERAADVWSWRLYRRFVRHRLGRAFPLVCPILGVQWLWWVLKRPPADPDEHHGGIKTTVSGNR